LKQRAIQFVEENVENRDVHYKFLEPDGFRRLLIARDWNTDKAFEMFEKWVNWRLEFKSESIEIEEIKHLLLKETLVLHGYDHMNRFCIIIRARFHKPGEQTLDELIKYAIFLIDRATEETEKLGSK